MTKDRAIGLSMILVGYAVFLIIGISVERKSPGGLIDLKWAYCEERALIQHRDPYKQPVVLEYLDKDEVPPSRDPHALKPKYIQLPTALFLFFPFGLLNFALVRVIWMIFVAGAYLLAALLMWEIAGRFAPILPGILIGLVLANSEILLFLGNLSAIVVSLCVIAVWCFVRNRFALVGVFCLATSMAIKPHDVGFIWLYFAIGCGEFRKRALQTLVLTLAISALAVLWIRQVSPDWLHELASNISADSARGSPLDPGPGSPLHGMINAQSIFSMFWDYPQIYNPLSYLLCGVLLSIWITTTFRSEFSQLRSWLALGTISALSVLPVYHRIYDAKLILLAVPACSILWSQHRSKGRVAVLTTTAAILCTGEIPLLIMLSLLGSLHFSTETFSGKTLTLLLARPALCLVIMSIVFLRLYIWACSEKETQMKLESPVHDSVVVRRA